MMNFQDYGVATTVTIAPGFGLPSKTFLGLWGIWIPVPNDLRFLDIRQWQVLLPKCRSCINGVCVANDVCLCSASYTGEYCDQLIASHRPWFNLPAPLSNYLPAGGLGLLDLILLIAVITHLLYIFSSPTQPFHHALSRHFTVSIILSEIFYGNEKELITFLLLATLLGSLGSLTFEWLRGGHPHYRRYRSLRGGILLSFFQIEEGSMLGVGASGVVTALRALVALKLADQEIDVGGFGGGVGGFAIGMSWPWWSFGWGPSISSWAIPGASTLLGGSVGMRDHLIVHLVMDMLISGGSVDVGNLAGGMLAALLYINKV
ncbi:hypothetical protein HDU76_011823 [Blyttiomyces sp. JEL0837]|nr:hypothetical protein HDU76_011823 [Blyttiomyces sp. JEL0837]